MKTRRHDHHAAHIVHVLLAGALLTACGGQDTGTDPVDPPQTYAISECGGFEAERAESSQADYSGAPPAYCEAEVLRWSYDAASGTLTLTDRRANLNCCGDRSVKVSQLGGGYLIEEVDAPETITTASGTSASRCHCMCVIDMEVELEQVPAGRVDITLTRDVTDSNDPVQELFSGQLDLSQGSGWVTLDKSPVMLDASGICPIP